MHSFRLTKYHPIHFSLQSILESNHSRPPAPHSASRQLTRGGEKGSAWSPSRFFHLFLIVLVPFVLVAILLTILMSMEQPVTIRLYADDDSRIRELDEHGYTCFVEGNELKQEALRILPKGYVFLDYQYTIHGCSLSSFHRDVTSSPYVYETAYPVYTCIVYHHAGPLLSVCPGSHRTTPYLYSSPVVLTSPASSTAILFHCDLVHAGAMNTLGKDRYVEQYKIAHTRDLPALRHLQHIHTTQRGDCDISYGYEWWIRKLSWVGSHIANHHFTPYLQSRPDTPVGKLILTLYGRGFYN